MSKQSELADLANTVSVNSSAPADSVSIDASGNLLVGGTNTSPATNSSSTTADNEAALNADGRFQFAGYEASAGFGAVGYFNRTGTDGPALSIRKNGTTVGSIGSVGGSSIYIDGGANKSGFRFDSDSILPFTNGGLVDNSLDMGNVSWRFDDIYATNGTIQTSDAREKENIASLTPAQMEIGRASCRERVCLYV